MRIAIISDIHSNIHAFQRALEIIAAFETDETICLGDIVGYGAYPNECIDLVRKHCSIVLQGNHDQAAADLPASDQFSEMAAIAAQWTHSVITPETKKYLQSLPTIAQRHRCTFVHSTPFMPQEWEYIFDEFDAEHHFAYFEDQICFVGHSHLPFIASERNDHPGRIEGDMELDPENRYIINVGSIGQPRDRDPRLSFGFLDTDDLRYFHVRAEYDVHAAQKAIKDSGLPVELAKRLGHGR